MDSETKVIGGRTYSFGIMPASKALKVEMAIAPVLPKALEAFAAGLSAAGISAAAAPARGNGEAGDPGVAPGDAKIDDAVVLQMLRAIGALVEQVSADDYTRPDGRHMLGVESIMRLAFEYVNCDGKRIDLDSTFTGRSKDKYLVLAHALRVNLGDFLPAGLSLSSVAATSK